MQNKLKGTGVAIVTPFLSNGNVDYNGLENLVERLITQGINYIVVLGTTGETATLSKDEKLEVINCIKAKNAGRVPLVIGIGGNNTSELVHQLQTFNYEGFTAVLSVSPYYNKPSQQGIIEHYKMLAKVSALPIILYNVPGRTGSNLTAQTTLFLANNVPNICGIKEASGNMEQIMQIIKGKPSNFMVISGDDNLTLPIIAAGGWGVISVTANAFTKDYCDMVNLCLQGNFDSARTLHYKLTGLTDLFFADGNPGGVKAALKMLQVCDDNVRLPLVKVNTAIYQQLHDAIANYEY
ncbi:MAG TPA: 4-hydroxy-tetrahydrodipicolinate synthase [Bacteroidia bacterium]|nr:4-hydroxy-tetrahydrodipicolinate synthase [Bacteroidia bacterium]